MIAKSNAVQDECIQNNKRRIEWLEAHWSTFNDEMGAVKQDVAEIKTDVAWLKANHWIVVTASTGALITAIINILTR